MDKSFIKERYARIRLAHNISARRLSMELGQSSEYINQIETGKSMPSVEGLINFCDYFGMSASEFFDDRISFPVEYKAIADELNKMDAMEIGLVLDLLKLINSKRENR
ncbi:MAG: helix-turn-helix domain-containing protein [Clostridiales bacterium]|nr:helix-turn-helix domain-containing protein [Clostridiales bacterium]